MQKDLTSRSVTESKRTKLLVLCPEAGSDIAQALRAILELAEASCFETTWKECFGSQSSHFPDLVKDCLAQTRPDLVVVCVRGEDCESAKILPPLINGVSGEIPVVLIVETCEPDSLHALLELGAADFILAPLRRHDVLARLLRVHHHAARQDTMMHHLKEKLGLKQFIGESPTLLAEIQKIPMVARCDVSVLISGETGTGKEMVARAVHYLSARSGKPFVPVNCGAIPQELVENELFGHERGAFTSATTSCQGLVFQADQGTLFLDELECLPARAQSSLLRFLQEKEYRSLGSREIRKADVRIIAASNVDSQEAIRTGQLRPDLYYRLNVIPLTLPPLRQRAEDIPLLVRAFLRKYSAQFRKNVTGISSSALRALLAHDWPGNIRELEHVIERAVVLSDNPVLQKESMHLPAQESAGGGESFRTAKAHAVAQFERSYIEGLLRAHGGNISHAAQTAKKNRRAFWQLMRKHEIVAAGFKPGDFPIQAVPAC